MICMNSLKPLAVSSSLGPNQAALVSQLGLTRSHGLIGKLGLVLTRDTFTQYPIDVITRFSVMQELGLALN